MIATQKDFVRLWALTFTCLAIAPAVLVLILLIIPGGQMLALVPAFCLSFPGYLLFGAPEFHPEYGIAVTLQGVVITIAIWLLISALIGAATETFRRWRMRQGE